MQSPPKTIPVFLVLAGVFSSVFYAFIILSGSMQPYALGLMWCPGVAAIISQLLFRRTLRGLGWPPGGLRYLLMSYGLPVIYAGSVYGIVWLTGLGSLSPADIAAQVAANHQGARDLAALIEPQVRARIVARFKEIGYTYVSLDLSGFRSGSLNEVLQSDE